MTIEANEYPDVWEQNDEHPSPKNIPTWADSKVRIKKLVETFLTPQFFGKIVVWGNKNWFCYREIGKIEKDVCILDYLPEAESVQFAIESYCLSGHLSVLFVPLEADLFLEQILSPGHYGKPYRVTFNSDFLVAKWGQHMAFLESDVFRAGHRIFAFSHDAQFLYEIFR